MDPTFRQLEYAVAVADLRHFRRAAERCHVTQPALSTQIQQLEEMLGVQLFERGRGGVLITPAGEEIIERARRVLGEVHELVDNAARWRAPGAGLLRFGVISTVAPYLLAHLLPELRRAFADYDLRLWEERTAELVRRLRAGEIDLVLLSLPLVGDDLVSTALGEEPFVLLTPRHHRLAHLDPLRQTDLEGEQLLLLEDGHCLREQALEVCALTGATEAPEVHASSLSTVVQMVLNGQGITLLPATAIPVEVRRRGGLALKAFVTPTPSRTLGLVWRRGSARESDYRVIASLFRTTIQRRLDDATGEFRER